jgi:predicted AlkP superfamily phosphohydrolase/phosphomutase
MAASRDPGSLGVYGSRNRADRSYDAPVAAPPASLRDLAVWDHVIRQGRRAAAVGVPAGWLPPTVARPGDDSKVDAEPFRTGDKDRLKEAVYATSRQQFQAVRHFLRGTAWDYLQLVDTGPDRFQHGFWRFHDPRHVRHEAGSRYQDTIRDYYLYLDEELGRILDLLDDETAVVVLSEHGARALEGGFCVNEWLAREGLLVLERYPPAITALAGVPVDWERTSVWSDGGYAARLFLNVKGREPRGSIDPADYERIRDDLKARLEGVTDHRGRPLETQVFRPEELYRTVRGVAPDLVVHFGALAWRAIGSVGHRQLHVEENDTGSDDCNHSLHGSFILAAPGSPLRGELSGAHILQVAPTLLELAGYDVPATMQGASLLSGRAVDASDAPALTGDNERILRERLRGLGYIS